MGHYVKEKYKDKSYSIGLFAFEGQTYTWYQQKNQAFKNEGEHFLEQKIYDLGHPISFINNQQKGIATTFPWLSQPMKAFEVENGGEIEFIPNQRFDGIISFQKVNSPSYN